MATVLERLEVLIDSKLNAQGLEAAKTGVGNLTSKLGPADSLLQKLGITGEVTSGQLAGLAAGAGAAAIAGIATLAAQGVQKFQALAGEVLKFQQVSGTSAETASRFVAVMDDYQVSADQGAMAISRLGKTIAQTPESLTQLGVSIERSSNGAVDMEQTFLNVVNAFNSTNDASQKAAIGTAAFGRNWQELANLLSQGSGQLREAFANVSDGQIISEDELRKSEEYRLAMDHLGDAVRDLEMSLGRTLVPALTVVADKTAGAIEKADQLASKLSMLKTPIRIVAAAATGGATELLSMGNAAIDTSFKLESLGATAAAVANDTLDLTDAINAVFNAGIGLQRAQLNLADANDKVAETQERLANGGQTLAEIQDEATSGGRSLASSQRQVEDAMKGVANAQERVVEVQGSLDEANANLVKSNQDVVDATNNVAKAERALEDARRVNIGLTDDMVKKAEDADRRLASSKLDVADAQDRLKASEAALAKAQQESPDDAAAIAKASRDVERARLGLADATRQVEIDDKAATVAHGDAIAVNLNLKDADGELTDAQDKLKQSKDELKRSTEEQTQATKTVKDRENDLKEALDSVADAQQRVIDAQNSRDSGAAGHGKTVKTTEQLERDLEKALLDQKEAAKQVADKTGEAELAAIGLGDALDQKTTPAAQAAAEKNAAIVQAIGELKKSLDPSSDLFKNLDAYETALRRIASVNTPSSRPDGGYAGSSANAAERALTQGNEVVPVQIVLDGQKLYDGILPIIRRANQAAG